MNCTLQHSILVSQPSQLEERVLVARGFDKKRTNKILGYPVILLIISPLQKSAFLDVDHRDHLGFRFRGLEQLQSMYV